MTVGTFCAFLAAAQKMARRKRVGLSIRFSTAASDAVASGGGGRDRDKPAVCNEYQRCVWLQSKGESGRAHEIGHQLSEIVQRIRLQ